MLLQYILSKKYRESYSSEFIKPYAETEDKLDSIYQNSDVEDNTASTTE